MRTDYPLHIIYGQMIDPELSEEKIFYNILHVYSNEGFIDLELLKDVYSDFKDVSWEGHFLFERLELLGDFAEKLCKTCGAPEVRIISSEEFNQLVRESTEAAQIERNTLRFGSIISNPEFKQRQSGFFDKIFTGKKPH